MLSGKGRAGVHRCWRRYHCAMLVFLSLLGRLVAGGLCICFALLAFLALLHVLPTDTKRLIQLQYQAFPVQCECHCCFDARQAPCMSQARTLLGGGEHL